jgi:hypothetical protein
MTCLPPLKFKWLSFFEESAGFTVKHKLAQKRLTLPQFAEKLGTYPRPAGCTKSRSQFCEHKKSFQAFGCEGLISKPSNPGPHPNELSEEKKTRIIPLFLGHPAFGQQIIAYHLTRKGISTCPTSICNVWLNSVMETNYKRFWDWKNPWRLKRSS